MQIYRTQTTIQECAGPRAESTPFANLCGAFLVNETGDDLIHWNLDSIGETLHVLFGQVDIQFSAAVGALFAVDGCNNWRGNSLDQHIQFRIVQIIICFQRVAHDLKFVAALRGKLVYLIEVGDRSSHFSVLSQM